MTENIYPEGSAVHATANPGLGLVVRRYVKRIYYCTAQDDPSLKDLVYYERELQGGRGTAPLRPGPAVQGQSPANA